MAGLWNSSLTRVRPFFTQLITADPSGAAWLSPLLGATPNASVLGPVLKSPGELLPALTAIAPAGHPRCFEYPVPPPRSLLAWFVANPDVLVWPAGATYSPETTRLRGGLLYDDPPGSREEAKAQALDLVATRPPTAREWWRFEGTSMLDCVVLTDKLALTIEGKRKEPLSPATDWYPKRSQLVRNLEAAKQIANGRAWASMLISEKLVAEGTDEFLESTLPLSAPHLSANERDELHAHYLGNITWEQACAATGVDFLSLPDTTNDL